MDKKRFEWLTSFLKRRWVLLSCAVVLLACSFLEVECFKAHTGEELMSVGIKEGNFFYSRSDRWFGSEGGVGYFGLHRPRVGDLPGSHTLIITGEGVITTQVTSIPIWLALSAVLGWIVFREMRWREKRAKECSTSQPSN